MYKILSPLLFFTLALGGPAFATGTQSSGQPGESYRNSLQARNESREPAHEEYREDQKAGAVIGDRERTTARARDVQGGLSNEMVGIKPQVGVVVFQDLLANSATRAAVGFTADANFGTLVDKSWNSIFLGPSVGLLVAHLGDPTSNIIGMNPDAAGAATGTAGANLLILPANLKAGYNLTDNLRLAAHGGGNVIHRTVGSSMNLGDSATASSTSAWNLFPNVGADAELGLGKNVALMLRPDFTFTPGSTIFSGTLAMNIPLT